MRAVVPAFTILAAALGAAEAPSRYATLDGAKVHYKSHGTGKEAVVFIHGWTCDHTFWKGQAPLYEKRRALLIDLPGHGASDKPEIAYTQKLFARTVEAVMRDAGVDKAALVGHSMGAPVALTFYRLYPDKVSGMVIVDAFIPPPPKDDAERQKNAAQFAGMLKTFRAPDYRNSMEKMIDSMFEPAAPAALREEIRARMTSAPQHVVVSAMEGMMALLNEPRDPVKAPALVVRAKKYARPGEEEYLRTLFPDLRAYHVMDGVGHFLMMEQPEKFNAAVAQFLDDCH